MRRRLISDASWVLVLLLILLTTSNICFAEHRREIGLRAGANVGNFLGDSPPGYTYDIQNDFLISGYAIFWMNDQLGLQPELGISRKAVDRTYTMPILTGSVGFTESATITDLEFAFLVRFPFPVPESPKPSLFLGPMVTTSFLADYDGRYEVDSESPIDDGTYSGDVTNRMAINLGFTAGVDMTVKMGASALRLDVRYNWTKDRAFDHADVSSLDGYDLPFADLDTGEAPDLRFGYFSISAGLAVPF